MIRAEDFESRLGLLRILQKTTEQACLRLFLDYHGLSLVWSWMVDVTNSDDALELKTQILQTLAILPITNKTMLMDSRVLSVVQRWAQQIEEAQQGKYKDGEVASSELVSQVSTPTNADGCEKSSDVVRQAADQLQFVAEDGYSSTSEENGEELPKVQTNENADSRRAKDEETLSAMEECLKDSLETPKLDDKADVENIEHAKNIEATVFEVDLDEICLPPGSPPNIKDGATVEDMETESVSDSAVSNVLLPLEDCLVKMEEETSVEMCATVRAMVDEIVSCILEPMEVASDDDASIHEMMDDSGSGITPAVEPTVDSSAATCSAAEPMSVTNFEEADCTNIKESVLIVKEESQDTIFRGVEETVDMIRDFVNNALLTNDTDASRGLLDVSKLDESELQQTSPDEALIKHKVSNTLPADTQVIDVKSCSFIYLSVRL